MSIPFIPTNSNEAVQKIEVNGTGIPLIQGSDISVNENNVMKISFREKFTFRRGRLNCSLNESGKWKWFGHQFTIEIPK